MRHQIGWLCLSMLTVTAQAGVVVHMAQKGAAGEQAKDRSVIYAQDGFLRVDDLDSQGRVDRMTLFRDGVVWQVEIAERTFQKFDKNAFAAQQGGMQARMQAMAATLPPDKRAVFEARMQAMQQKAIDYSLADAGRSERVNTYSCEVWRVTRNGNVSAEYCIAAKGSLPGGDELVDASHKAAAIAVDVVSAVPQMAQAVPPLYLLYGKMDGFPVLVRQISGNSTADETSLSRIERQALAPEKFEIPHGFTETQPGAGRAKD
ncbi:MAG TPA: hypothetical protein VGI32_15105 [Steroidobacteraceae bacterium]